MNFTLLPIFLENNTTNESLVGFVVQIREFALQVKKAYIENTPISFKML